MFLNNYSDLINYLITILNLIQNYFNLFFIYLFFKHSKKNIFVFFPLAFLNL